MAVKNCVKEIRNNLITEQQLGGKEEIRQIVKKKEWGCFSENEAN